MTNPEITLTIAAIGFPLAIATYAVVFTRPEHQPQKKGTPDNHDHPHGAR